jgi:hypothetical protein
LSRTVKGREKVLIAHFKTQETNYSTLCAFAAWREKTVSRKDAKAQSKSAWEANNNSHALSLVSPDGSLEQPCNDRPG